MGKIIMLILTLLIAYPVWGDEPKADAEKEKKPRSICPVTLMSESCMDCHVLITKDGKPKFGLKEIRPDAHRDYPRGTKIIDQMGYYKIEAISETVADEIRDYFRYLDLHQIKSAQLDIQSPGGNLFSAWRIKGLINEFQEKGGIVEARLRGIAASAGSILFLAGSKGHRYANPQSELMFHELWGFKFLAIETPSDKEDEARIYRHLQNTISEWIATRGRISKTDLDEKIRKKEFWINGQEAFEIGFADQLIMGK